MILRNESKTGSRGKAATPVVELVGNGSVGDVELTNLVLETLDNRSATGRVEGTRRVPGDAAELVQELPRVAEGRVHPSLGGEVAQRRGRGRVGALQRQTVVRPGKHQQLAAIANSGVVEDESTSGGGEAVVQANSSRVDAVVLVKESLVAGLDESDHTKDAVVSAAGLDGALSTIGGGGSQGDGRQSVDHVGGAGSVNNGERSAGNSSLRSLLVSHTISHSHQTCSTHHSGRLQGSGR